MNSLTPRAASQVLPRFLRVYNRRLCVESPKPASKRDRKSGVYDRHAIEARAELRRRHQAALATARWVSSWMMPWERAQMDSTTRPLTLWERAYWRLLLAVGGAGLVYETWVLGNRRLWVAEEETELSPVAKELYEGGAFRSTRLLSDEEIELLRSRHVKS